MARSRTARRALAARRLREPAAQKPAGTTTAAGRSRPAAWPARITHDELDQLAARHGVVFGEGASKAEKQAMLDAAGVTPEG